MREVYLYKKIENKKTQCLNCAHYCVVLPGKRGVCGVRENIDGKLYALNYGRVIAANTDPIEKKPLFHFLPGSRSYSFSTAGCNFACKNCQNWDISQALNVPHTEFKKKIILEGREMLPKEIVNEAIRHNCPSISYTYTEPTIFLEFALDAMKIAKKRGLKNVWVSNGFMTEDSAKLVIPHLDANNIDIKGFSEEFYRKNCGARLQPVLNTAKIMKKSGVWVEITTLVIPTLSDSEETFRGIAEFIYKELGPETPWHVTRFSGAISWKLRHLPDTPFETLEKAWKIGKETGLKYVYTGNMPGIPSEDTFCPHCRALVIDRTNYAIQRYDKNGKCQKCNFKLDIID
jgi:pyruvate formate lyase activating enzyme